MTPPERPGVYVPIAIVRGMAKTWKLLLVDQDGQPLDLSQEILSALFENFPDTSERITLTLDNQVATGVAYLTLQPSDTSGLYDGLPFPGGMLALPYAIKMATRKDEPVWGTLYVYDYRVPGTTT